MEFPYAWFNTEELIGKTNITDADRETMNKYITLRELGGVEFPRIKNVFACRYVALLEALAAR